MPLDEVKTNDTSPPPLAKTFASPGKRYVAVYLAAPSWGDPSPYKAYSKNPYDPGAMRFIKEEDLGAIARFDPQKTELPIDCLAIMIFEEGGFMKGLYMYGEILSHQQGRNIEYVKASKNGIEIYQTKHHYVRRNDAISKLHEQTNMVIDPETRSIIWKILPNQNIPRNDY